MKTAHKKIRRSKDVFPKVGPAEQVDWASTLLPRRGCIGMSVVRMDLRARRAHRMLAWRTCSFACPVVHQSESSGRIHR